MSSTIHQGLILTSHINDKSSGMEISFYGRRQNGQPFKLVFENQKFVFFISHLAIFEPSGIEFQRKPGNLKDFSHRPVDAVYLERFSDVQKVKDYCEVKSLQTFELDIAPAERFLMERFINGKVEFIGKEISSSTLDTFINPQIRPLTDSHIELALLSLDIETGVKGELYSIGLHFTHKQIEHKYVLMLSDENRVDSDWLEFFDSESKLIKSFLNLTAKWDPDIICGWHVIGFDLMFLERKCNKLGIELKLGREDRKINLIERKGAGFFANIPGRIVLDGPPILRGAFYTFKNFKLETVAQAVLGLGKDIASDAGKGSEIERRFKEDKLGLAKYNLLDCTLVLDIFEKLGIVDMLVKRVQISGLLIDRLAMSTAAFDHVYLPRLHRKGYIAPNRIDISRDDSSAGGMVIEPKAGLHKDIAIFDFKSLYPSIIMSFKIDPLSKIMFETDTIETPEGFKFSDTQHILPEIIDKLMFERQQAKDENNSNLSQAIKILMNSFYGVMGSSRCRFYHADLPQAITTTGHYILKTAMDFFENRGHEVMYGDTDSIFVRAQNLDKREDFENICHDLDVFMAKTLMDQFGIQSRLECEFEKKFDQIYFSMARGGQGVAKKRYAGIMNGEIEFKGMEVVRSDWTELAKIFQANLYEKFFANFELENYIKEFIKELEDGKYDDLLVYTKRLSKAPQEYTKNIPVHVKAALKIDHQGPYRLKEVSYIITKNGPEPVNNDPQGFDYQHYIEKQLKPIADDILLSLGKSFDALIIGDQLSFL